MSSFDSSGFSTLAFSSTSFDVAALEDIENANAILDAGNRYEICDLSGWKMKPGEGRLMWNGLIVKPQFWEARNWQDFTETRPEEQRGPSFPEPIGLETFIDPEDPITADDL